MKCQFENVQQRELLRTTTPVNKNTKEKEQSKIHNVFFLLSFISVMTKICLNFHAFLITIETVNLCCMKAKVSMANCSLNNFANIQKIQLILSTQIVQILSQRVVCYF